MTTTVKTALIVLGLFALAAVAAQPVGIQLDFMLNAPLTGDPVRKNVSLGTTIVDAIDSDTGVRSDSTSLLFVVSNLHAAHLTCVGSIPVSTAETCNETLCATATKWTDQGYAATMNCTTGDASMGSVVPAGQSRALRYAGNRCVCIVASGAGTTVQVERVVR